jgi:hypothetical protein
VNGERIRRTRLRETRGFVVPLAMAVALVITLAACGGGDPVGTARQGSDLLGKTFPSVTGESLAKQDVTLPGDFAGAPLIVLVAPSKGSQPDADRWLGALRTRAGVAFVETPVLPSLLTRLMQGFINGKMRGGEPKVLWPRIVPMYKDGDVLKKFFGEHGDRVTYVAVLDKEGVIRAFTAGPFDEALAAGVLGEYEKLR